MKVLLKMSEVEERNDEVEEDEELLVFARKMKDVVLDDGSFRCSISMML